MCADAYRSQKRVSDSLGLELKVVVCHLLSVNAGSQSWVISLQK